MKKILWVFVNCNSGAEADRIGRALLTARLTACYDIFARRKAAYFWPPRSGRIETTKGALLVVETLPRLFARLHRAIKQLHSDKLPFIGAFNLTVESAYFEWIKNEVTNRKRAYH